MPQIFSIWMKRIPLKELKVILNSAMEIIQRCTLSLIRIFLKKLWSLLFFILLEEDIQIGLLC
ncbi:MAG: hypothetical protein CMJ41_05255 [Phycisphaerae bacterium]|nr:hypothetical protein [Phycisphaerae bacterium]